MTQPGTGKLAAALGLALNSLPKVSGTQPRGLGRHLSALSQSSSFIFPNRVDKATVILVPMPPICDSQISPISVH